MKNKFAGLGLEAIDHQVDSVLHKEMTLIFRRLNGTTSDKEIEDVLKDATTLAAKVLGIAVKWEVIKDDFGLAVDVPRITKTHPIVYKIQQAALAKDHPFYRVTPIEKIIDGGVDRKRSKLFGDFTSLESTIYLPKAAIRGKLLLPEEWAAATIHEFGHIFTYFEFLGYTSITNLALDEASKIWLGSYPVERRVQVLVAAEANFGDKIPDKESIAKNDDPRVAHAAIVQSSIQKVRSELGLKYYDQRVFEFLSDQFAARHGAGRYLVTGLDKFNRAVPWMMRDFAYRSTGSMIVANLFKLGMLATGNSAFGMALGRVNTTLITGQKAVELLVTGVGNAMITLLLNDAQFRYDTGPARAEATRREVISALKRPDIDKAYLNARLEDLDIIDQVQSKLNKLDFLDNMLFKYLVENVMGVRKEFRIQQEYEKLANNELFARAAKLTTLDKA